MSSEFQRDMTINGWPQLIASLGRSVSYTPDGGEATLRTGIFLPIEGDLMEEKSGLNYFNEALLKLNDTYEGISVTPADGDKVTVDGVVWHYNGHKTPNGVHEIRLVDRNSANVTAGMEYE